MASELLGPSPIPGWRVRAVPPAAFIPSLVVPALLGRMHGAVRVSGQARSITFGARAGPAGLAGPKTWRPRAWLPARGWWSCRRGRAGGRRGQGADLPVAQAVVDQGEELAGGGDLGDVAGLVAAAGDDAGLDRSRCGVGAGPLDGFDQRPAECIYRIYCNVYVPKLQRV